MQFCSSRAYSEWKPFYNYNILEQECNVKFNNLCNRLFWKYFLH